MIQVTIGTTLNRTKVIVDPDTTLKQVLQDNEVDYSVATVHLDGAVVSASDMNKTFTDMSITEDCMLIAVIKSSNA